ncbi:MAG: hypothetical protein OQL19_03840 [Gammaproteobacteria bacterium]|nr:hypothetical protein [Gammaproteobacteria bacterium]
MSFFTRNSKLFLFYILIFNLFVTSYCNADETIIHTRIINESELVFDLPKIDTILLAEKVENLRDNYIQYQNKLLKQVTEKALNIGDALITIIIPGGLLYAAFKKNELEQDKEKLLAVDAEINELSYDLIALQTQNKSDTLLLARLP